MNKPGCIIARYDDDEKYDDENDGDDDDIEKQHG